MNLVEKDIVEFEIGVYSGAVTNIVALQREGSLMTQDFPHGVCIFSMHLCGFSLGTPLASSYS